MSIERRHLLSQVKMFAIRIESSLECGKSFENISNFHFILFHSTFKLLVFESFNKYCKLQPSSLVKLVSQTNIKLTAAEKNYYSRKIGKIYCYVNTICIIRSKDNTQIDKEKSISLFFQLELYFI